MSSSTTAQHVPATPSRHDRLPFPHSTPSQAASPMSVRTAASSISSTPPHLPPSTSGGGGGSSSSVKPTTAPITLAALLAAHASAPDPHMAALDQALSERNALSSQNSQLWKLIEKQRSGYNQMLKELERVRSERDAYRGRIHASSNGAKDKQLKNSSSNSAISSSSSSSLTNGSNTLEVRPPPVRHQSDEVLTPRNERSQLPTRSQTQDQVRPSAARKTTPPPLLVPPRAESLPSGSSAFSPDTPQHSSSSSAHPSSASTQSSSGSSAGSHQTSQSTRPPTSSQTSVSYPPRNGSSIPGTAPNPNLTTNPNANLLSTSSLNDPPTAALPSPPTMVVNSSQSQTPHYQPSTLQPGPSAPSPTNAIPPSVGYSSMMQAALAPPQPLSATLSPVIESSDPKGGLQRESRISLPDEAKRYIANMGESPVPSPKIGGFPAEALSHMGGPPVLSSGLSPPNSSSTQPEVSPITSLINNLNPSNPSKSPLGAGGEFLDMDEADDDDDDDGDGGEGDEAEEEAEEEEEEAAEEESRAQDMQQTPPPVESPVNERPTKAAVDDFPLPPSFGPAHVPQEQAQQQPHAHAPAQVHAQTQQMQGHSLTKAQAHAYAQAHARAQAQAQAQALERQVHQDQGPSQRPREAELAPPYPQIHVGSETHSSPYLSAAGSSSTSLMNSSSSVMDSSRSLGVSQTLVGSTTTTASPAFRALPLISTDLPHTRIVVSNSSIRPNDRGKEVLSFIVEVDPGHGKEPWKVEKLFSDVIALDQRMRSSVGKNVLKKIGNLPEGKLWRDHAPAKVDQRKAALETYLQTLIDLPVKDKNEIIAFFCSDVVRETKKPVYQAGYKEGYLTKRGKNFGGWKTRYFVLQGPVLEYYESRGGTHLGSITITGAQIGRQQRAGDRRENDDEKEYRHAFLIIEAKKGPSGTSARHVLCAESDSDRDDWVEVLVRYVMGAYNEDPAAAYGPGPAPLNTSTGNSVGQPRSSTSSNAPFDNGTPTRRPMNRVMSKDDIIIAKGPAVPISQLPPDAANLKLFQVPSHDGMRAPSPSKSMMDPSPVDRQGSSGFSDSDHARRILERGQTPSEVQLSSSLPTSSPLDAVAGVLGGGQRANSELGHYPDLQDQRDGRHGHSSSPERHRPRDQYRDRKSFHPTLNTVPATPNPNTRSEQEPSADPATTPKADQGRAKISGPLGGTVIPAGYKFGGKDAPSEATPSTADRREKAKSRSFWGFGKNASAEKAPVAYAPRAVFGVTLEDSLDVIQIANLPAVVFRCIQYLEAKKADQEEGIYRLSGSSAVIKSLKDRFNAESDVDLLSSDEYWDPHAIAGLLKSFLRELPASILTRELHLQFLSVIDFVDPQERIKELSYLISSLPIANYSLLRALTAHLIHVVQSASVNKMTMRNVGIVFSPTLGIPAGVFSLMLGEFNRVFNVDAGGIDEGVESDPSVEDISRRNSRQYSDAAADQLLGLAGRSLTAPVVEEVPSDAESIDYESGHESTNEDSATADSSTHSSPTTLDPPNTPKPSKASHTAASRGLNIAVSNRGNRHSRIMGLPVSPRVAHSPSYQSTNHPVPVSPLHTPK